MNDKKGHPLIRLSKSVVGSEEKELLGKAVDAGYLGMGATVKSFEDEIKAFLGAKNVVSVNSGTAALHLGVMAAGIGPGDQVLVQSLTFVASYQAITAAGATPVSCEIDPETCLIDLADAENRLTPKTRAIMPVHYTGDASNIDSVYAFAKKHGLRVIEDAAHAFGTVHAGRMVGSFGDIVCFSFDGIKNITTGEGGAVVTADQKASQFVEDARLLGVHRDTEKRFAGLRSWEFEVHHQGYRFHMSNLFAAVGLAQLKKFPHFKARRVELAKGYDTGFAGIPGIKTFRRDYGNIVPHIYVARITGGRRDELRNYLAELNIESGVHYYPNHYQEWFGKPAMPLPVTESVYEELLSIPLHPEVTGEDQRYVVESIRRFFGEN